MAAPYDLKQFAEQEIRIAAVLNGGVSLAVWMSGVTLELHHLAMASAGLGNWTSYAQVLDKLGASARVDVIAGTSAGGLNGAFLALGISRRRDFALLRDVWAQDGALEKLLRKPLAKSPPSALDGDAYFLVRIKEALESMVSNDNPDLDPAPPDARQTMPPVELILTGTLWSGRQTRFTDDMGVGITERDYNATFRFVSGSEPGQPGVVGDLDDPSDAVLDQLAAAARCTSSFPGAFEPHYVQVSGAGTVPGRWPSSAGQANFDTSQYVLDGGVLLNKPLRPALDSIYEQPAQNEVRRVLGYVVPDPGEEAAPQSKIGKDSRPSVPVATDVLLGVLTRLTSTDSVSRELAEIRDTNATVRERRRSRARLSMAMDEATAPLAEVFWPGYMAERIDGSAATIAAMIAAGQAVGPTAWSEQELSSALARVGSGPVGFGFVPRSSIADALDETGPDWSWGQTTVVRLADMTVDLMKRAVTLAPLNDDRTQGELVAARGRLESTLALIAGYTRDLNDFWTKAGAAPNRPPRLLPRDPDDAERHIRVGSATNVAALDAWLAVIVSQWDDEYGGDGGGARRAAQYDGVAKLASTLVDIRPSVARVLQAPNQLTDPTGDDRGQLAALYAWLLPADADVNAVLSRMLQLDVVLVATSGTLAQAEQEVELVQMSCGAPGNVTGMQLHHFGAFYRTTWRLNDWIEGRMDGTRQVMRILLDPARLRQRGYTVDSLLAALKSVAVPNGHRDEQWLDARWKRNLQQYTSEVTQALDVDAPATALDLLAEAVAMPVRLAALRDDLDALADAIRAEGSDTQPGSAQWLLEYDVARRAAPQPESHGAASSALNADQLWRLRINMAQIGSQRITEDVGSDNFARTVSHAAVVGTGAFTAKTALQHVKAIRLMISGLRGYTAMVYGMVAYLTRGSVIGSRMVELAVAIGGSLLAVTIFVPSVPLGLTLAGILLLLAGASASALLTRGARGMGLRVLLAALLVGGALGYLIWRDVDRYGFHGEVVSVVIKVGIGLLIVLLGWFIANGGSERLQQRKPERRKPPRRKPL